MKLKMGTYTMGYNLFIKYYILALLICKLEIWHLTWNLIESRQVSERIKLVSSVCLLTFWIERNE